MSRPRYAVYYTPPEDHPLTRAAARWIGRSPFESPSSERVSRSDGERELTAAPRRYGFHATLKAPFCLREKLRVTDLEDAIRSIARTCAPCRIGPVKIGILNDFFALIPVDPVPALHGIAARIVQELDRFRAPPSERELEMRLRSPLDEVEMANLGNWGYPYVLDRFRFHMTLTDPVDPERRPAVRQRLEEVFLPLLEAEYYLDALSVFVQPVPQADFVVRSQFSLSADVPGWH
jgi:putative phosphonate metabolism protein